MDRRQHQQGGASGQGSNKKNKRKKNSGIERGFQGGGGSGSADQGYDKRMTPTQGGGNAGRNAPHPKSNVYQDKQLLVSVDRGNRQVLQGQARDLSSAHNKSNERQEYRQGNADSNTNGNNNARYRDRGKARHDKKPDKPSKDKKELSSCHTGVFVSLEGKELLRKLAEHRIFELKKKNLSFPNAKYFCRLCEYHLDRPLDCERHVDESRHQRKKEALDMEGILENIPEPSVQQIKALDCIVDSVAQQEGLSPTELQSRQEVVGRLQSFLRKFQVHVLDDVTLQLYGSSLTGVGLKKSDVNIDVSGPGPAPTLLTAIFGILKSKGGSDFTNARNDFNAKIPVVLVQDAQTEFQMVLTINAQAAVLTSSLLQLYSLTDPRVQKLCVTLRTWAKICHLDQQEAGTLPPFAYNIMVVYFLQQVQPPVLGLLSLSKNPVEIENKGNPASKVEDKVDFEDLKSQVEAWQSENKNSVGQLWLQLLKFYCLEFDNTQFVISLLQTKPLTRQEKKWNSKKLAIEDPFSRRKNIANSLTNTLIFEYYQACVRKAYEYFGMPRDKDGKVNVCLEKLKALASKKTEILLNENQEASKKTEILLNENQEAPSASPSSCSAGTSDKENSGKERAVTKEKGKGEDEECVDEQERATANKGEREGDEEIDDEEEGVVAKKGDREGQDEGDVDEEEGPAAKKGEGEGEDEESDEESTSEVENGLSRPVIIEPNKSIFQKLKAVSSKETTPEKTLSTGDSAVCSIDDSLVFSADKSEVSTKDVTADSGVAASCSKDCADSSTALSSLDQTLDSTSAVLSPSELDVTIDSVSALSTSGCCLSPSEMDVRSDAGESFKSAQDVSAVSRNDVSDLDTTEGKSSDTEYETFPETPEKITEPVTSLSKEMDELKISQEGVSQQSEPTTSVIQNETDSTSLSEDDESYRQWYSFTEHAFTGGKGPAVICGYCEQEGHIKAACPEDKLPPVVPLPPMTSDHMNTLESVIGKIIYDFAPNENHVRTRQRVVRDLEHFVQQIYPDAVFSLFGSSCNGFGFHLSDLDICMTFRGKKVEDIDVVEVIERVAKKLTQRGRLYSVIAIPTAKVPIVKFQDHDSQLEGDISLYNTLAQRNTRLLYVYSEIDKRVKILGYTIKVFAKVCEIGDASRGSLSSYGYILMMLHYLQQCRPPVIPVLQQLHPEGECPELIVEGCNTWFFEDLRRLPQVWRDCGKNRQGLADLWLGFLRYYLEEFDWKTKVVTIRQSAPLSKFEKMWNGNTIAVEDPFDLSHNLGGGLSRKMNNFIYKTFVNGRLHFGVPFHHKKDLLHRYRTPSDYFFDVEHLRDGRPPNDRGCRLCGKIGHVVKDCPNRSQNRRRQNQNGKETKDNNNRSDSTQQKKEKDAKETKGEASSQGKGQTKGQAKGQNKEGKSQNGKGENKEAKQQDSSKTKGQTEPKDLKTKSQTEPKDSKAKLTEERKSQGDARPGQGKEVKGQSEKQNKGQDRSKQGSGSKVLGESRSTPEKKEKVRGTQVSSEAATTSAVKIGVSTTSTSITTTAASTPATTTTSSGNKIHAVPHGFSSTPIRMPSKPDTSAQGAMLPSPVKPGSKPLSSTPVHGGQQAGVHPPGPQIDLQQLFTMAQQSGDIPIGVLLQALQKQPVFPPGFSPPPHLPLTPEQQVARLGALNSTKGLHSTGSAPQLGASSQSPKGTPEAQMTPVSLMALFQAQSPTSQAQPPRFSSSPQQMTPLPVMSLFSPHSSPQQASPASSSHQTPTSVPEASAASLSSTQHVPGTSTPQQMTPLPLNVLFPSQQPGQQTADRRGMGGQQERQPKQPLSLRYLFQASSSQQQQQQIMSQQQQAIQSQAQHQFQQAQQQFMQNFMHKIQEQNQTVTSLHAQTQLVSSQLTSQSTLTGQQAASYQNQPVTSYPQSLAEQQRQLRNPQQQQDQPGDRQQQQRSQPIRIPQRNSSDKTHGQSLGSPSPQSKPGSMPHHAQFQQQQAQEQCMPFFWQMSPDKNQLSSSPHTSGPAVHSYQHMSIQSQSLSSTPPQVMMQMQPIRLPHESHMTCREQPHSQQQQQNHPEGVQGQGQCMMQPPFSQSLASHPQQSQPMAMPSPSDPTNSLSSWPQQMQGVNFHASPYSAQQQQQQQHLAYLQLQHQQLLQQQQQQIAASPPQGMAAFGQASPGHADAMMFPHPNFQMVPGAQNARRERTNSSSRSTPDATG